ncbi:MAG: hypothetical protein KGO92_11675 [Bacteroidota bacterium]|nr:hypothetical protein [Bacteroidota bacterium]
MKLIEFIRLIRKHLVVLIAMPLLLALLVMTLTKESPLKYTSETVLYTGLATGSSVEMDKTFNYFVTNTGFDNLINIINSRVTQEEVAIRLLSQHLMLSKANPTFISEKSFAELKSITPAYIYNYISKTGAKNKLSDTLRDEDTAKVKIDFPEEINRADYEATVDNLTRLMKSSDTNFVYKLLNHENPHYSIKAISNIKAQRIGNSDLIKIGYEVDDPGICQQTLLLFNEACIKNYKNIKENRSDEVIKYFELQLKQANDKLASAEDKLLNYNQSNNIINYYEQSKAVAVVKEDLAVDYSNKRAQLAGLDASIRKLEQKLDLNELVQAKSGKMLDKKRELGDVNYQLATLEAESGNGTSNKAAIEALRNKSEKLKAEIHQSVDDLYSFQNTVVGVPTSKVMNEWVNNTIEADNLRAKLQVMEQHNKDFQKEYAIYAPAGANIKRIEREISVSEQGYLELLHGLNLAKLKLQDNELSSNLKTVDQPYFPIEPVPTKRKILIIAAGILGFILVMGIILFMEYADNTLRNAKKAGSLLNIRALGMLPRIVRKPITSQFPFVLTRLLEIAVQNIEQSFATTANGSKPRLILIASTQNKEGKTVVATNLTKKLSEQGEKVLLLKPDMENGNSTKPQRYPLVTRLFGYADPRIDQTHPFLTVPENCLPGSQLQHFTLSSRFYQTKNYTELLSDPVRAKVADYDYIIMELPALLSHNYPAELVAQADLTLLVVRSNRNWSEADQTSLEGLKELTGNKIQFLLNGVNLQEVESLLGELPKQRSFIRKKIKSVLRSQFFSKNQI